MDAFFKNGFIIKWNDLLIDQCSDIIYTETSCCSIKTVYQTETRNNEPNLNKYIMYIQFSVW